MTFVYVFCASEAIPPGLAVFRGASRPLALLLIASHPRRILSHLSVIRLNLFPLADFRPFPLGKCVVIFVTRRVSQDKVQGPSGIPHERPVLHRQVPD